MKNKKIAFHIGSLNKGGAERVVANLAEYFYSKGYEVYIITKFIASTEYSISKGIHRAIGDISKEEERGRFQNLILRILKLRKTIKEINPDIVVSFIGKTNLMSIAATMGTDIPVVVSVRSNPAREIGSGLRKALSFVMFYFADGIILQTSDARKFFPKGLQKKSVILQNSINPQFVRPSYSGERRKEIVSVGRIDSNKNQEMLVEAFADVAKEFPDWTINFYGDGEKRVDLEKRVIELKLENQVLFKGVQENIAEKIEGASIFVLTSKQEGMPNALIEAMVLGIAPISTDCPCGGPRDLIVSGENGILIPVNDVEALRGALKSLMQDAEFLCEMSEKAVLLREKLLPEKINQQWEKYLRGIAR